MLELSRFPSVFDPLQNYYLPDVNQRKANKLDTYQVINKLKDYFRVQLNRNGWNESCFHYKAAENTFHPARQSTRQSLGQLVCQDTDYTTKITYCFQTLPRSREKASFTQSAFLSLTIRSFTCTRIRCLNTQEASIEIEELKAIRSVSSASVRHSRPHMERFKCHRSCVNSTRLFHSFFDVQR